jgi:hypothetical protein
VEAAEGAVHEGEAIIGGLEEEGVIVAAETTVEGSESLRSQFIVGMLTWVDVLLGREVSHCSPSMYPID